MVEDVVVVEALVDVKAFEEGLVVDKEEEEG